MTQDIEDVNGVVLSGRALFADDAEENGIGVISYRWEQRDREDDVISELTNTAYYVEVAADEVKNKHDAYYTYNPNEKKYVTYVGDLPAEEGIKVYKMYASLAPQSAGNYYLIARNVAGRANIKEATSRPWRVAFASSPELDYARNVVMNDAFKENGIVVNATANGTLTYQWMQKGENGNYIIIDNHTNNVLKDAELIEGYYAIKVKNTKNNDEMEIVSDPIRVTNPAEAVNIGKYTVDGQEIIPSVGTDYNISMSGAAHTISVTLSDILPPSDNITYQWYNQDGAIEEATSNSYTTSEIGLELYVVITNTYNTDTATTESCHFMTMR